MKGKARKRVIIVCIISICAVFYIYRLDIDEY